MDECVAVYIDCENINHHDYQFIEKEIRQYGRIIVCNLYADWQQEDMKQWSKVAIANGLRTIQCDKISGKNSVDLRMAVDLTCFSYERTHVNTYVVVTTDSDFRHVIFPLREKNKIVIGIGYANANKSFTSICDKYTKIENLREQEVCEDALEIYWDIIQNCIVEKGIKNVGDIKRHILLYHPTFDVKDYNSKRFSQFLIKYYGNKLQLQLNNDNVELIKE